MGERQAQVLQAAIELLDEVGLDGLTMRRLAGRLGIRASALYRHYPSKQALLDAMVAHLVAPSAEDGITPDQPWGERLRKVAEDTRAVMLAHRDGAVLVSTFHCPSSAAVATFHDLVGVIIASGVNTELAVLTVDTVLAYVNGFTIEEQARKTGEPGTPREHRDRAFRDGLDLILSGAQIRITHETSAPLTTG